METWRSVGTTVFRGTQNFEPSHGICLFPWNFYVFAEFPRNSVLASDKVRNTAYFGRFQIINYYPYMSRRHDCAVKYATATRALTGYWAEFIWNIASLFGKQTWVCQLQLPRQIVHI